ncbi:MAG: dimethylsulfoniopropionate lyase [Silicimonas sp.]|jgi:dimethylpropiothetin dethiomethylase|nr:dimethylsulfoniopropionate lyase [Silicimonas sp.]
MNEATRDKPVRLSESPDWRYLLREVDAMYRRGSDGGSAAIRRHRRHVRERLSAVVEANSEMITRVPEEKPVCSYLGRALDNGQGGAMAAMARALARVASQLTWEYGYAKVPKALAEKYAYCELMGPQGPVPAERIILGLVLFAPKTTYPQHSHADIEESYISISGAWSENDLAVYAPGSLILNRAAHEHRITTGAEEPCLLAYAWTGFPERLSSPGMKFSARRKARIEKGI